MMDNQFELNNINLAIRDLSKEIKETNRLLAIIAERFEGITNSPSQNLLDFMEQKGYFSGK